MNFNFFNRFGVLLIVLSLLFALNGCQLSNNKYSETYTEYFDTVTTFTVYNIKKNEVETVSKVVNDELQKYHRLFDIYNEYDGIVNLKNVNDNAGQTPLTVDSELIDFLTYAVKAYELTEGYVNVAMGSVLKLWHECRTESLNSEYARLPDAILLEEAGKHIDINSIEIDEENLTVFITDKDTAVDVGAIGKGYAAQKIYDLLKRLGYNDFILSLGGNVVASGTKNNSSKWQIGIQSPENTSKNLCTVEITNTSVVTSGSYHRYYTVDGINYHHIINPYTLYPENYYFER